MPTDQTLQIELVQVQASARGSEDDWYIHLNGECYGYLYRCTGYAVGICKPHQEIKYSSVESSKDAAIEYAKNTSACYLRNAEAPLSR